MPRQRLGEMLVSAGLITEQQLQRALAEQKEWPNVPLGRILLDLGFVREEDLIKVLSVQLGVPTVNLDEIEIPGDVLKKVPAEVCQRHNLIPFRYEPTGRFLDVAMVEPLRLDVLDELRVTAQANVRPYFTTYSALARALLRYHGIPMQSRGPSPVVGGFLDGNSGDFDDFQRALLATDGTRDFDPSTLERQAREPPRQPPPAWRTVEADDRVTERLESMERLLEELRGEISRTRSSAQENSKSLRASLEKMVKRVAGIEAEVKAIGELARNLSTQVQRLQAYQERDERVLKRLLGLIVDKGLCTSEELTRLLQKG